MTAACFSQLHSASLVTSCSLWSLLSDEISRYFAGQEIADTGFAGTKANLQERASAVQFIPHGRRLFNIETLHRLCYQAAETAVILHVTIFSFASILPRYFFPPISFSAFSLCQPATSEDFLRSILVRETVHTNRIDTTEFCTMGTRLLLTYFPDILIAGDRREKTWSIGSFTLRLDCFRDR